MKRDLAKYLAQVGLDEAEIQIYLELLKAPVQTKFEMLRRTGLERNKVYRGFERLAELKMVDLDGAEGIRAKSLKHLVARLQNDSRKAGSLASKLKNLSPYLHMQEEGVRDFEMIYDRDRLLEAYMMMSELNYNTSLDFGDFEGFVPWLGGDLDPAIKFRKKRALHADNHAICTTDGPNTRCMARKSFLDDYRAKLDILQVDFRNRWVIFSAENDYVLFNDMTDADAPYSVLINSPVVADVQRLQFRQFSQMLEKC